MMIEKSAEMEDEIEWGLAESDIEWTMHWHDGRPSTKEFEPDKAVALLLMNHVVMLGGWTRPNPVPEGWAPPCTLAVLCSDTFGYAIADAEDLPQTEVEHLYRWYRKSPTYGPMAWCVLRRKTRPIPERVEALKREGLWTEEMEAFS